jgi:hypothetical protein
MSATTTSASDAKHPWRFAGLAGLLAAAQLCGCWFGGAVWLAYSLPATAALLLLWVVASGTRVLRGDCRQELPPSNQQPGLRRVLAGGAAGWRNHACWQAAPGMLAATVLVALVVWQVEPQFRVQFDESSLAAVAWHLHREGAALMTTAAVPFAGETIAWESTLDKRPPLFALLVAAVHLVAGPAPEHAFVVNAGLLWVLLVGLYQGFAPRLGRSVGLAAQLLATALPLLPVLARSGGFELLATCLLVLVTAAAWSVGEAPSPARWRLLVALAALLGYARYESLLLAVVVLGLTHWRARQRGGPGPGGLLWWLLPAWVPLLFLVKHGQRADFHAEAAGAALWSLEHLRAHSGAWLLAQCWPPLASPWPGASLIVGVGALVLLACRRRVPRGLLLLWLPALVATLLVQLWFFGDVAEPGAARLYLPGALLGALLPLLWAVVADRPRSGVVVLVLAMFWFGLRVVQWQAMAPKATSPASAIVTNIEAVVLAAPPAPGPVLWISCAAQHLILRGHAAMTVEALGRRQAEVQQLLRRGHIRSLRLLQTPLDEAFAPAFGDPAEVLRAMPAQMLGTNNAPGYAVHELRW